MFISYLDQQPKAYSLQGAIHKVSSSNPPLVIEFNGSNHFDAWVRELPFHKGHRFLDGLLHVFPNLGGKKPASGQGKRKVQEKEDEGQGGDRMGSRRRPKNGGKRKK